MGACSVKRHAKVLAKGRKLEIRRWWLVQVFLEIPHRSLERAEHVVSSRQEDAKSFVPGLKKGAVKGRIVGDKLGDEVRTSVFGKHGHGCIAAKEVAEALSDLLGLQSFLGPEARVVVVLSKTVSVGLTFVEENLCFKGFYGLKLVIDGNGRKLNDWVPLRV
jgi:hypothetical protein